MSSVPGVLSVRLPNADGTLAGFIVQAETSMLHFAALLHKETDQCVFRHRGDIAFPEPVGSSIPLAGGSFTLQIDAGLLQAPVREPPAIEAANRFPAGIPFAAGAGSLAAIQYLALGDDRRMVVPFSPPAFRGRTLGAPGPEYIRPVHAQERGAPGDTPGLRPGSFPLFNHQSYILCSIHSHFLL